MKTADFYSEIRSNCLGEFIDNENNETVLYIEFDEEKQCINVGTCSNCGLITYFSVNYDDDFSLDQNLENVMEEVYNNGFIDIEY
mgnify:FL=1